jgi:3-isopropylmalate/(R)-2-methylmalate dehydratase small subunit
MITGKVWKYGDHINTDLIIPGRYLDNYDLKHLAAHAMEDVDVRFSKEVRPGDIIVAGRNFGCGSSREQAPLALKAAGVAAVIAGSVSRIFYRNAINVGLPIIVCLEASRIFEPGDTAEVDLAQGVLRNPRTGESARFNPPPEFLLQILQDGGLVPHLRKRMEAGPR